MRDALKQSESEPDDNESISESPSICELLKFGEPDKPRSVLDILSYDKHFQKYRDEVYKDPKEKKDERAEYRKKLLECQTTVNVTHERKWMIDRGKEWMLDFSNTEIKKLKK